MLNSLCVTRDSTGLEQIRHGIRNCAVLGRLADSPAPSPPWAMTVWEALDYLWEQHTRCGKEDIHTPELRKALHVILAAHPETKRDLIQYWNDTTYAPDLWGWQHNVRTALLHPLLVGLDRACGRRWTIDGYVEIG